MQCRGAAHSHAWHCPRPALPSRAGLVVKPLSYHSPVPQWSRASTFEASLVPTLSLAYFISFLIFMTVRPKAYWRHRRAGFGSLLACGSAVGGDTLGGICRGPNCARNDPQLAGGLHAACMPLHAADMPRPEPSVCCAGRGCCPCTWWGSRSLRGTTASMQRWGCCWLSRRSRAPSTACETCCASPQVRVGGR